MRDAAQEPGATPAEAAAASAVMPDANWSPNNQSSWELVSNRAVEKFRLAVRPQVPPTYSGPRHLASIEAVCAAVIVLCLVVTRTDEAGVLGAFTDAAFWVTFALTCVFANGMEYYLHKNLMHPPGRHTRHSALHHRFFTNTRMALDDFRADPNAILFHPRAAPVFFGLILPVAAAALGLLLDSWRVGVYFELTGAFYYASYEVLHLAYHMDEKQYPVLRLIPFLPFLRRHHLIHHYQPHMRHCNFNITVPLFDALCGTLVTALPTPSPAQASAALDAEADAAGGAVGKPPKW